MLHGMYRYRCEQCATTSPVVRTWVAVDHERDRHRRKFHGGHIPDGERVQRTARAAGSDRIAIVCLSLVGLALLVSALAH